MPPLRRTALVLLLGLTVLAPTVPAHAGTVVGPPTTTAAQLEEQAARQRAALHTQDSRLAQAQRDAAAALQARQQAEREAAEQAAREAEREQDEDGRKGRGKKDEGDEQEREED